MESKEALILREHANLITAIKNCEMQKREIDKQEKNMRELLLAEMEKHGAWDLDFEDLGISFTRIPAGEQRRIDTDRLRAELPIIAEDYTKTVPVKASIRINVKKEKKA